ncbi:glycine--tRNA ligase subunit beta [Sphingorhabdus sp. YGSMI21]|uniref:glycine--tRNA ligase subunit beta n=1 Tax=Sphingorhabdus sp. YGSMI21 TaxID=2077182 RepID=UPI000C1EEFA6|nr:glycine--tRNA ligase subunit beta [Sphingorhabdus sp. YGSMI21]ATW04847.1 glycine--tRNA ligase subunit beta [Sphingorhabdus sp. YGSMI21]
MTDFLLELLSEEIPARMQAKARVDLERLFTAQMAEAGLTAGAITVYSTPRRLALIARDLPEQTEAVSEEAKGPPEAAPDQAVEGFCRKNGVTRDQLEVRDVKGRPTYFAVINKPGRDTKDVLAEAIPAIIKAFPWPKSMRWGEASLSTESLRWVRPLSGIVAIFGDDLVCCEIDGLTSGYDTVGHRFHHQGMITIGNAGDYADKLRACHVIVDHEEREDIVFKGAQRAPIEVGLTLVQDQGLVVENAGLTEWPVPLLGHFDKSFLDVPEEVIQLTARVNQKYFVLKDGDGKLTNAFVCTANIDASDGGKAIVAGNEKVLAARLSDAKFFWELDQKTRLEDHAKKLSNIVFHEKLGTVADKVERVAKLAEWLASLEGTGLLRANPEQTKQAARLCKADLVTEMVGEFPELQGLMGGYYAEKEGLPAEVSHAIRDHYKPVGQGDEVPTDPVTVCVSLADKLDTLFSFFDIGLYPTGSKDPFALRRAALGIIRIILENGLILQSDLVVEFWLGQDDPTKELTDEDLARRKLLTSIPDFYVDRLKVQLRENGVRHDIVDASERWNGRTDTRIDRIKIRAEALQAFVETTDGVNLLAGYKRASNILKKEAPGGASNTRHPESDTRHPELVSGSPEVLKQVQDDEMSAKPLSYTPEKAEKALIDALDAAQPEVTAAIAAEQFETAMAALAALRGPIDQFFEDVTVNDDDEAKREARLALLARFRNAVHQVADFSQIEG